MAQSNSVQNANRTHVAAATFHNLHGLGGVPGLPKPTRSSVASSISAVSTISSLSRLSADFEDVSLTDVAYRDSVSTSITSPSLSCHDNSDENDEEDGDSLSATSASESSRDSVLASDDELTPSKINPAKLNEYAISTIKNKSTPSLISSPTPQALPRMRPVSGPLQSSASASTLPQRPASFGREHPTRPAGKATNLVLNTSNTPQVYGIRSAPASSHNLGLRSKFNSSSTKIKLTRKQLEAQYDLENNADDGGDLPDDCMWNVPLSPALYAKSRAAAATNKQSPHKQLPTSSKSKSSLRKLSATHEQNLVAIKEAEPTTFSSGAGLELLGSDAQILTRAFQTLPDVPMQQKNRLSRKRSVDENSLKRTRSLDDPLTRAMGAGVAQKTRMPWLPPKSKEEEERHLKEHRRLLEKSAEAEKQREIARHQQENALQKVLIADQQQWSNYVIPNFDKAIKDPKVREMWWRGIPSKFREQLWKKKIGNSLKLPANAFQEHLAKAVMNGNKNKYMLSISADAEDTFTQLKIFAPDGPMFNDLVDVLLAYSSYNPGFGYRSGTSSICAMFLLNMSPGDAFIAFTNFLNNTSISYAMLIDDEQTLTTHYASFLKVLNTKLPSLFNHFQKIHLWPATYLEPMLMSAFTQQLSVDIASRVWDVIIFEGDSALLRVALAVLIVYEQKLYADAEEVLSVLQPPDGQLLQVGNEHAFMAIARNALKA